MATESQLSQNSGAGLDWYSSVSGVGYGQKLTITDRTVTKLTFKLNKTGTPTGTLAFVIRKVSDNSIIATKTWGNAVDTSTSATDYEVTLGTPVYVNEQVRIAVESSAQGGNDTSNYVQVYYQFSDVKASEQFCGKGSSGVWQDGGTYATSDCYYIYTYDAGYHVDNTAPSATNQAVSAIAATTATGNGNVTGLGIPAATQHGHVWATHPITPIGAYTTQDYYLEKGAPSATGAYTSSMTGLTQNTTYYVRSYITNTIGTFYGTEVSFSASADKPVVTTVEAMAVVVTTAVGHGKITNTGGVAVTAHGFVWSTSTINTGIAPTAQPYYTDEGTGVIGDFYTTLTTLTASTTYKLRAYATNANGYTYGAEITITTPASGTPIISAQECTNDVGISAIGNGTILDIGAAAITAYGHVWSTSTINMSVTPTSQPGYVDNGAYAGTPPTAFISQITLLTAGTTYYVRPYATNSYGYAWGDEVTLDRSVAGEAKRIIAVGKNKKLYFIDDDGVKCVIVGTAI